MSEKVVLVPKGPEDYENKNIKYKFYTLYVIIFLLVVGIVIVSLISYLQLNTPTPTNPSIDYIAFHNQFYENIDAKTLESTLKNYSTIPHLAGTPNDYEQAKYTQQQWKSFGIDAYIDEYPVLLTYPKSRKVSIVFPQDKLFNCTLAEKVVNDTTSSNPDAVPTWNGWSASGNVTGELVYANYGSFEDFEQIKDVNLTNKIVIVRYGKIFRGNKVKFAQQRGAAAVLIYSDPGDTGYLRGTTYPEGPWGTNSTVQRGTIWTGNGDPLTPGWTSSVSGPRLSLSEAQNGSEYNIFGNLPSIPVQPLSYGDAYPLLMGLQGIPINDSSWRGGFNLTHLGPGPVVVNVDISVSFNVTSIWNVIGKIEGAIEPDRIVLMGAHRDAWTFGAVDPISGQSVLMETARGYGSLLKQGWKPHRTIMLCSWDAEEYGLIGSVEFAEKWAKTLSAQAVVYLNMDTAVSGTDIYSVSGSPSLYKRIKDITKRVYINSTTTIYDLWPEGKAMDLLGEGSDYTAFIQHIGIASIDMDMYSKEGKYSAVYHSNYDSNYWVNNFDDPGFVYHAAMARMYGLLGLEIADSVVLPFDYEDYANVILKSVNDLKQHAPTLNYMNFNNSVNNLLNASIAVNSTSIPSNPYLLRGLNDRLMLTERTFLSDPVLSGREWYLHVISAPSNYNSYSGSYFPAIYDAIQSNDLAKAQFLMERIAQVIDASAQYLQNSL